MSSQNTEHIESIEVHPDTNAHPQDAGFLSPDASMVLLSWITFFLLLALLNKFAWEPILGILDNREKLIRDSLENADKITAEMQEIHETRDKIMREAELKAEEIIEQSRQAAVEAAKVIEHKTREEVKILLENAQREIKAETANANAILRQESSRVAIELASKLIEENLDDDKNRKFVNRIIKEI